MQKENPTNSYSALLYFLSVTVCIMFPVGLLIMLSPQFHKYLWTTSLFLLFQSILTYLILIKAADIRNATIATCIVLLTAYLIEYIGVKTGFPFGNYSYSDILKPSLLGVPLAIPFAWLILTINSLLIIDTIISHKFFITKILLSSLAVVSFDIMLEPFASFVNKFWVWENNHIPFSNYISWFAMAFIMSSAVSFICLRNKIVPAGNRFSYIVLLLNFLNFVVINIAHGYYLYTITGILLLTAVMFSAFKIRALHGV